MKGAKPMLRTSLSKSVLFSAVLCLSLSALLQAVDPSFIGSLNQNTQIVSTIPKNGDINPYGVAVVPFTTGKLVKGHILVSNFNNSSNLQGTGTTIVDISPEGDLTLFAQIDARKLPGPCPGGVGLTTALAVLRSGWVIVGSLPTTDGTGSTAQAGCLIVLDRHGHVVETISGGDINGPWDMTALDLDDLAILFVANVLNGTVAANGQVVSNGTVLRIVLSIPDEENQTSPPAELSRTVIGFGFDQRTDPNALVIGPTGLGLDPSGVLFVADTLANRIAFIPAAVTRLMSAGTGTTVSQGGALNGPLGLAIAPNGNVLVTNGGDGNMVEVDPSSDLQVAVKNVDTTQTGAGTLFGLAVIPSGVYFVNDGNNTLNLLH
jgi:hypothetical protein